MNEEALNIISKCILPIGGWSLIDTFFPNSSEDLGLYPDTYLSEISGEFFRFGYFKLINDDVSMRWFADINMTNGIPANITQRYFNLNYLDILTISLI